MLEKSLDVTERVYRDYVTAARKRGWHLAGDFLERYLNGAGGKVTMSREQALGFKPIADADKRIKGYFERAFLESGFSENKKFLFFFFFFFANIYIHLLKCLINYPFFCSRIEISDN